MATRSYARYTHQERRNLVNLYITSGKSKTDFCKQYGVNISTFAGWFNGKHKLALTEDFDSNSPLANKVRTRDAKYDEISNELANWITDKNNLYWKH